MSKLLNPREALAAVLLARGERCAHAWQSLRVGSPTLAGHLETLGNAGWSALGQAVIDIRKAAVLAMESMVRTELARHGRDAREAWETVRGAGGADNGGDLGYLWDVAPTAATRLRDAAAAADAGAAAAWFPWTARKARDAAWTWTSGYLDRGYQQPGSGIPSWLDDFDTDTRARVARNHPREAYHTTLEGAAAAWACQWAEANGLTATATEEENNMPWQHETQPKTALAILAGLNKWESGKRIGQPTGQKETPFPNEGKEVDPHYVDPSVYDDED